MFCFCTRSYASRAFRGAVRGQHGDGAAWKAERSPCGPGEKVFSPHPHHPICPCACVGASLIYTKLDYTLLILPILYCVNRAPPENRMIMRFVPFHFFNPLQTDVNRLQTDAFQLQLRAFWMHLCVTSLHPTCTWLRGGCNGKFARIRVWAMENAALEIRPEKFGATESSGKKYSPHAGGSAAGMGAVCALLVKRLGRGSCLA